MSMARLYLDEERKIAWADIQGRLERLAEVCRQDGIQLASLFGSVLEGKPARDVDVAVLFREYSFDHYLQMLECVQRALGTVKIDLVALNRANAALKLSALLQGEIIFTEHESTQADIVGEALFEYEDFRHFVAEFRQVLQGRCQEGLSMVKRTMNRTRVETHLSALDEAVAQLNRLQGRFASLEEFKADVDTRELCVHYLRIALESVLDICRHFLAVVGVSLTEIDTTNLIELAGEKGLLTPTFAHKIRGMAGMRNAIVHVYWRLDYEAVHQTIAQNLGDFDEFARQVQAYLGKEE
jgi:uncharacterized protein YutE (UPF0331/DUF86 family)/predicted nucleotidyltransferase